VDENELEDLARDIDHLLATWTVHYDIPALELSAIVLARLHYLNLAFESWDDYVTLLQHAAEQQPYPRSMTNSPSLKVIKGGKSEDVQD
jgi:hypothetical protein